ncbi:carbohydrate kinase FGGY [Kribbella flavida DSM 17836]|uniref:Carbohydrate kinase FGGY n=1 Tax=Kribbella flavida (strain DSM 17836 / JCM 10339 / NBRC 14399) TaxID=479435 RepID=D2PZS4_KRIFD|nr:FGGY family carbohydrate kinase [Kribbella flavida]ADB35640.1 carbohydrate kinase FGGY [Kribbella flavida DSM 17836]
MAWIGVDLGTQSVRAVLVDPAGAVLARAARPLTSRREGVRHEQNPAEWTAAVGQVLAEVVQAGAGRAEVEGLAICSTSGTVALTDRDGRAVSPGLMYDDARAADVVPRIVAADPERWGSGMQPTWALPKVLWLRPRAQLIAHSADVVAADLAGHPVATDTSHALKTGYDLTAAGSGRPQVGAWPVEAFERLGLPADLLPEVVLPGTRIGAVSAAKAQLTGVPAGTPIFAGMTDGCAAQIAAGALSPGTWNSVLGTTLVLKGVTKELIHDPSGAVYSHRHPDGDGWLPGGASNTGAGALTTMLPGADLDALDQAAVELAARGPVDAAIYPLTKPGERFPFVAPDAQGFELGAVPDDLHRYVAVLQGVAFIERLAFEHLTQLGAEPPRSVALTGGAVRSNHWNQLRADVLGVPVELPAAADPAYGMAVLAASGGTSVAGTARRMVRIDRVIEPRPAGRLDDLYAEFVAELDRRGYRR